MTPQLPATLLAAANPPPPTARDRHEPGIRVAIEYGIAYANRLRRDGNLVGAGAVLAFCMGLSADGVGDAP